MFKTYLNPFLMKSENYLQLFVLCFNEVNFNDIPFLDSESFYLNLYLLLLVLSLLLSSSNVLYYHAIALHIIIITAIN